MGTGNRDVGETSTNATQSTATSRRTGKCQGAMAQQGNAHGYDCTPQTLVRLVGYRDPNGRPQSWDRLRATRKLGERVE